jgi:hypothetical protein
MTILLLILAYKLFCYILNYNPLNYTVKNRMPDLYNNNCLEILRLASLKINESSLLSKTIAI